ASGASVKSVKSALLKEALNIQKRDIETCRKIGEYGLSLFKDGMGILTHCNPGSLATAGYGTATAPFYLAKEKGWKKLMVYVDETRPLLQGSRLTDYELQKAGI
ncbi:MAG TPA: S-methyl-5-thioribose-1-phosphate isomerase, partial [Paenibacillaceae bacterium]|nr:S-methyl-5-thioribose-1-phosphate isomerase [Paenibacillaceae bacterium]